MGIDVVTSSAICTKWLFTLLGNRLIGVKLTKVLIVGMYKIFPKTASPEFRSSS